MSSSAELFRGNGLRSKLAIKAYNLRVTHVNGMCRRREFLIEAIPIKFNSEGGSLRRNCPNVAAPVL